MVNYPLSFEVLSKATKGIKNSWESKAGNLENIKTGIPIEFSGPKGCYTPEDFFALSIINCMIASFKYTMEKKKKNFDHITAKARIQLDISDLQKLFFSNIEIFFEIKTNENKEDIKNILNNSIKSCPVSSAVSISKIVHIKII